MERYPTEEKLLKIEKWDFQKDGSISDFLEFVKSIWNYADIDYFHLRGKRTLKLALHTGGWSSNEDIIGALQKNFIFWSMCWRRTERGGHFYFQTELKLWKVKGK